jgi:hypothetical protein
MIVCIAFYYSPRAAIRLTGIGRGDAWRATDLFHALPLRLQTALADRHRTRYVQLSVTLLLVSAAFRDVAGEGYIEYHAANPMLAIAVWLR